MRKATPQVAKRAAKVGKTGSRWANFGPSGLTFDAGWAIFGLPGAFLHTFKDFFCVFEQYSRSLRQFARFFRDFHYFSEKMYHCSRKPHKNAERHAPSGQKCFRSGQNWLQVGTFWSIQAQLGPFWYMTPAVPFLASLGAFLHTFNDFFCVFVQYS